MNEKRVVKNQKINLYNFAIIICVILIIISAIIIINPDWNAIGNKIKEIGSSVQEKIISKKEENNKNTKQISENEARQKAAAKFKELGEETKEESLQVITLERNKELYYYITSKDNTMEVKMDTGKITRLNSVVVNE